MKQSEAKKPDKSSPERHHHDIAVKTLKMPPAMAGVMGGPSPHEAEKILRSKYGYSSDEIRKLKGESRSRSIVRELVQSVIGEDNKDQFTAKGHTPHDKIRHTLQHHDFHPHLTIGNKYYFARGEGGKDQVGIQGNQWKHEPDVGEPIHTRRLPMTGTGWKQLHARLSDPSSWKRL
jgi:hypothetical protein